MNDHDHDHDEDERDVAELASYSADLSCTLVSLPADHANRPAIQAEFDRVVTLLAAVVSVPPTP